MVSVYGSVNTGNFVEISIVFDDTFLVNEKLGKLVMIGFSFLLITVLLMNFKMTLIKMYCFLKNIPWREKGVISEK